MAHPCWNDNNQRHTCETAENPFLTFSYDKDGLLSCHCASKQQSSSVYIASRKCPGQHCFEGEENPILDWDEEKEECLCRPHPCWNLDGERHECTDPQYPLLHYFEELDEKIGSTVQGRCRCL